MTICAIHQPNFLPWAGYFNKIREADIFIFLDSVAYPKSGSGSGSWCNRVKFLSSGNPSWVGLPITRQSGTQLIKDVFFTNKEYNVKVILKTLDHNYKKTPNYQNLIPLIESLLKFPSNNLADFNINAITSLSNFMGFKTQFIRQSELNHHLHSTALLIELLKEVNADTYLCGNGSGGYQEDHLFKEAGINLIYQNQSPAKNFARDVKIEEEPLSMIHLLFNYYENFLFK